MCCHATHCVAIVLRDAAKKSKSVYIDWNVQSHLSCLHCLLCLFKKVINYSYPRLSEYSWDEINSMLKQTYWWTHYGTAFELLLWCFTSLTVLWSTLLELLVSQVWWVLEELDLDNLPIYLEPAQLQRTHMIATLTLVHKHGLQRYQKCEWGTLVQFKRLATWLLKI